MNYKVIPIEKFKKQELILNHQIPSPKTPAY